MSFSPIYIEREFRARIAITPITWPDKLLQW